MIHIDHLTINLAHSSDKDAHNEILRSQSPIVVRDELVSTLRLISEDSRFTGQQVLIPEDCEKFGFVEGSFDLPTLLHFLADMLE